jgi:membrane protein
MEPKMGLGGLAGDMSKNELQSLKERLANLNAPRSGHQRLPAEAGRGREAGRPTEIPAVGWKDILLRSWGEVSQANLFLVAGGVTYAVLLALFPGLAALVSIYGLLMDPSQIEKQVSSLTGILPEQAQQMLSEELHTLVTSSTGALGLSAILALVIALWSASRGMSGLITALNIAYEEPEKRGFLKLNLIAVGLTIGLTIAGIIVVALVAVLPAAVQFLPLGELGKWLLLIIEWPLLIGFVTVGLAVMYRYAPSRDEPQWKWVSPGAGAAVTLWIIASIGFTAYVAHFNSYSKTYGSLGGVIILLTWLYISSFVILFGAAINAQSEKQTRKDSTAGHPEAMGRRGARAADTLGETR